MTASLLIKAPDGRIVTAHRGLTTTAVVDDCPVTSINKSALKPGWSIATASDIAATAAQKKGG